MCGIAGFIDLWDAHSAIDQAERAVIVNKMCQVITHRGPDDQGFFIKTGVALGMKRLSIIDVEGGHQPIASEDGKVTIVFNGEIYNFRELYPELVKRGHVFQTKSDTEAIVHAYEEFGPQCVNHLRGMFAFAIWDENEKRLLLARDRVGKKPLYYTITRGGTLVFGSELKAVLNHPGVDREIDFTALDAYLTLGYVPDPLSIFAGCRKLMPGHYLSFKEGQVGVSQYWDFEYEKTEARTQHDYLEELRALLDESVRLRLISDVPLGAFLSGGIDSSTIVALMARHQSRPVKTFSIGFHEDSYNELKYARLTARKFGTEHHEFVVTPDICDIVDELAWYFDEPFADSSAIPTYVVSKLARDYVKVVLTGDGGDELFAGYTRYPLEQDKNGFSYVPRWVRKGFRPLVARLSHNTPGRNYIHNISLDPMDRYLDSVSVFTRLNKTQLYTAELRHQLKQADWVEYGFDELASKFSTGNSLDRLLYVDSKTYLPGDILTKVDRMSMAVSLEARAPLLDHKLIDFVTRLPASLKMVGKETKRLLKLAVQDLVPPEILNRPKQGFGVPIHAWINRQLRERMHEILTDSRTRRRGYLNPEYIDLLLDEHERGRRDHSTALWALLMLELWQRQFIDKSDLAVRTMNQV